MPTLAPFRSRVDRAHRCISIRRACRSFEESDARDLWMKRVSGICYNGLQHRSKRGDNFVEEAAKRKAQGDPSFQISAFSVCVLFVAARRLFQLAARLAKLIGSRSTGITGLLHRGSVVERRGGGGACVARVPEAQTAFVDLHARTRQY